MVLKLGEGNEHKLENEKKLNQYFQIFKKNCYIALDFTN